MNIAKALLPDKIYYFLHKIYLRLKVRHLSADDQYQSKNIGEVFSEVYKKELWAQGEEGKYLNGGAKFYSGSGSYNKSSVDYIRFITEYIRANNIHSLTDIGCGDFNIGKQICQQNPHISYYGVDVVSDLINYNSENFGSDRIKFYCLNTLAEKIPQSDLLLIRQVLQHLSNGDIAQLTRNCFPGFGHILVTEHQPKPEYLVRANIEKSSGPNSRVGNANGSGVYLDKPPFGFKWTRVLTCEDDNPRTEINTFKIG